MNNTIQYKGYVGSIEFSEEDKIKQTNRYKIYISMWQDN